MKLWILSIVAALVMGSIAEAGILQRWRERRQSRHADAGQVAAHCSGGSCTVR